MTDDPTPDETTPDEPVVEEPAHDILAAEGFSMGASDPTLRHDPVEVPAAPFSEGEPVHDVLAAEEFAVPATDGTDPGAGGVGDADSFLKRARRQLVVAGAAVGVAVAVVLRRRR